MSPVVHSGLAGSVKRRGRGVRPIGGGAPSTRCGNLVSFHGVSSYVHMLTSQRASDSTSQSSVRFESPVGVVRILNQATQSGLATVLWIVALINIFIGIFNLLPIFPLDGARVAVALYEGVRSRRKPYRVDMAKLLPAMYLGLAVILFIGLSSLFLDLRDLASLGDRNPSGCLESSASQPGSPGSIGDDAHFELPPANDPPADGR